MISLIFTLLELLASVGMLSLMAISVVMPFSWTMAAPERPEPFHQFTAISSDAFAIFWRSFVEQVANRGTRAR
jgi:hypothetical protein